MMRFGLIIAFSALLATAAAAQMTIWNPDTPRARREGVVNPAPPAPIPGQVQVIEPERWGTLSTPMGQTTWGTIGALGWVGVTTPPPAGNPPY